MGVDGPRPNVLVVWVCFRFQTCYSGVDFELEANPVQPVSLMRHSILPVGTNTLAYLHSPSADSDSVQYLAITVLDYVAVLQHG